MHKAFLLSREALVKDNNFLLFANVSMAANSAWDKLDMKAIYIQSRGEREGRVLKTCQSQNKNLRSSLEFHARHVRWAWGCHETFSRACRHRFALCKCQNVYFHFSSSHIEHIFRLKVNKWLFITFDVHPPKKPLKLEWRLLLSFSRFGGNEIGNLCEGKS